MTSLVAEIETALSQIIDPCSLAAGGEVDLVSLGLLEEIRCVDGAVEIELCLTQPGCFFFGQIASAVEDAVTSLPGVTSARVSISEKAIWTPGRMTRNLEFRESRPAGRSAASVRL